MKTFTKYFLVAIFLSFSTNSFAEENQKISPYKDVKVTSKSDINKVFDLGIKAYDNQKFEDAIELFKKITDKFPAYGDAHYYIGLSYFSIGKYTLAIASFLEAHKIFGKTKYDALFSIGLSYLSLGYNQEARISFQKVVKESSDKDLIEDARNWLNNIDEENLQKEKIDLLASDINFREGIEELEAQNYPKAQLAFEKSVNNKPNSLMSLYYWGNTLYLNEEYQKANDVFEKIILLEPESRIARDANLYIRIIEEINATLPNTNPYYLQVGLGTLYDSNLSYSDINETIISDMAGLVNLQAGYNFTNNLQAQYGYYGHIFSGINDKTPGLDIKSSNFNLQRHTGDVKFNYSYENVLSELNFGGNWYFLGGNSFLFNTRIAPQMNWYINPNLITTIRYSFDFDNYATLKNRNNIKHNFDLEQYLYLLDNFLWFKLGYNFQKVYANDQPLSQSGLLTDGNKYDLIYYFSNSLLSNQLSLDSGLNLFFNSKLKINTRVIANNYDNPDQYRLTSPVTNIATNKTENKVIKEVNKKRSDFFYSIGFTYSIPIFDKFTSSFSYNFTNNLSNITSNDYIGRSYSKHIVNLNVSYEF